MNHGDLYALHRLRAALVHGRDVLGALAAQPAGQLVDSHHHRLVLLADGNRVADVVAVAVGAQQYVHLFLLLLGFGTERILRDPRIDEKRLAFRGLDFECGVAQPSQIDRHVFVPRSLV